MNIRLSWRSFFNTVTFTYIPGTPRGFSLAVFGIRMPQLEQGLHRNPASQVPHRSIGLLDLGNRVDTSQYLKIKQKMKKKGFVACQGLLLDLLCRCWQAKKTGGKEGGGVVFFLTKDTNLAQNIISCSTRLISQQH